MKYIIGLSAILLFFSCENDFDIIEDPKDIPVVYGFISLSDTAQYIRLERAFVDENISALEIAQNPDSLYYENAGVSLVRNSNNAVYQLQRVDGNLEGYVRESGVFAQSPNYLYKIHSSEIDLVGGETYTLRIERGDNFQVIEAMTVLLNNSSIKTPNPINAVTLDFDYVDKTRFIWQSDENAAIHDLFIRFNYRERGPETGGQFITKSVSWPVSTNINSDEERVDVEVEGINFYSFLRGAIPVQENVERRFEDMDMIVISGGTEIQEFVAIGSANLGITSTQDVPVFSNIPEGRGIFSSRNTVMLERINLSNPSLDSLRNGTLTRDLNF